MKLSICIPTYNRASHLANCLQSILFNKSRSKIDFQVCVSNNGSTDETERVVFSAQDQMPIKYRKNSDNLGISQNFLDVVEMADGEFVWIIGDDDLLLSDTIHRLSEIISQHSDVDYFYINSFHLTTQHVFSFPQPFDISNLPVNMEPFSSWPDSGEMKFMDLIDPRISFDFLGGMYLSVFRRKSWIANAHVINTAALDDSRIFSHFDNTFPHIKIFSKAFANSKAFFQAKPLSVCLTGAREWAPMYPFVKSIRLVEALDEYRKNGLPTLKYVQCKNFALRTFLPDFAYMLIHKNNSGFGYLHPTSLLSYFLYPNFYLSVIYFVIRKIKAFFSNRLMN